MSEIEKYKPVPSLCAGVEVAQGSFVPRHRFRSVCKAGVLDGAFYMRLKETQIEALLFKWLRQGKGKQKRLNKGYVWNRHVWERTEFYLPYTTSSTTWRLKLSPIWVSTWKNESILIANNVNIDHSDLDISDSKVFISTLNIYWPPTSWQTLVVPVL